MFTKYELEEQVKKNRIWGLLMKKIKNVWQVKRLKSKFVPISTTGKMQLRYNEDWSKVSVRKKCNKSYIY